MIIPITTKFIDKIDECQVLNVDLRANINQLKECLDSEDVKLDIDDILKAFEFFIRRNAKFYNTYLVKEDYKNIEDFMPLNIIISPVSHFTDDYELHDARKFYKYMNSEEAILKSICFDKSIKLNDTIKEIFIKKYSIKQIDVILSNLDILFKEFTIFANDILHIVLSNKESLMSITLSEFEFEILVRNICGVRCVQIYSSLTRFNNKNEQYTSKLLANTFSPEEQRIFNDNIQGESKYDSK